MRQEAKYNNSPITFTVSNEVVEGRPFQNKTINLECVGLLPVSKFQSTENSCPQRANGLCKYQDTDDISSEDQT